MKKRIISLILSFFILFQGISYTYWSTAAIGSLLTLSQLSLADYIPTLPATATPAVDDSDGDGVIGPFDAQQEALNIGVTGTTLGLPTADSSGTNLTYTDHNGAVTSWEMNDTSSQETSMFPASMGDASAFNVNDLQNGYGNSSSIESMTNSHQAQIDAEDPSANPTLMGMTSRDLTAQAENDIYHDMRNDPIVSQAEEVDRSVSEVFTDVFSDCEAIHVNGTNDDASTEADCFRTVGSLPASCTMQNEVILTPIGGAAAVALIIDDSGSMGQTSDSNSRMSRAITASLVIATAMDEAVDTEIYSRSFKVNPVQDWGDTVGNTANAYNSLNGGGGTPLGQAMHEIVPILNSRPEPNKIVIAISDGDPNDAPLVHSAIANNPGISWYGIGIDLNSIYNYAWDDADVVDSANVDVAVFNILTNRFDISNQWVGDECQQIADLHTAGIVSVSASCTTPPNTLGCVFVDTLWICPGTGWHSALSPSPFPGQVGSLCGALTVSGITYNNSNCWTDASGDSYCIGDTGLNTCDAYVNNPNWGIDTSQCIPSAVDPNTGECLLYGETYLGGYGTTTSVTTSPLADCGGPVHCADGSCYAPPEEENPNFEDGATYMHMTMTAAMEQDCDIANPDTCMVFGGEGGWCHKNGQLYSVEFGYEGAPYGIVLVDCCEQSMQIGLSDYLQMGEMIYRQEKTQQMLASLQDWAVDTYSTAANTISETEAFNYLKGATNTLIDGVSNSELWKTITKPFAGPAECVYVPTEPSAFSQISAGITDTIAAVQSAVANFMGDIIRSIGGGVGEALVGSVTSAAADQVTQAAANSGASGTSSGIIGTTTVDAAGTATTSFAPLANFLGPIMTAYMIYQFVTLAANLIDGCEQHEFEFNTQRELGACSDHIDVCTLEIPDTNIVIPSPWGTTTPYHTCAREERRACCFGSPLSRIINEQAALQGVGSPVANLSPKGLDVTDIPCGGLTLNQLESLDWSEMDLREWTEQLATTDKIPESPYKDTSLPASPYQANTEFGMDNTTSYNSMSTSTALTRAEDYTNFDMDDVRESANEAYMSGGGNADLYVLP